MDERRRFFRVTFIEGSLGQGGYLVGQKSDEAGAGVRPFLKAFWVKIVRQSGEYRGGRFEKSIESKTGCWARAIVTE